MLRGLLQGPRDPFVTGEENDLALLRQLHQSTGGPKAALLVEVHEDVVGENGNGPPHVIGAGEQRNAQGQIQLLARAEGQMHRLARAPGSRESTALRS